MIRTRTFICTSLFALALATGCKPGTPDGTNPPDSSSGGGEGGGEEGGNATSEEGGGGEEGGGEEGGGEEKDLTQTQCDAEVAEVPYPLYGDSILIRPPKGVEGFVENSPFDAYMNPSQPESVSCVEGLPGAIISRGQLFIFEDNKKTALKDSLPEYLEKLGYAAGTQFDLKEEGSGDSRYLHVGIEMAPDDQNPEPAKAWVVMRTGQNRMVVLVYETHANAFNALRKTFEESGRSVLILAAG